MSEVPNIPVETQEEQANELARKTAMAAGGAATLGTGAIAGAYVANSLFAPTVEIAPGVNVQASLMSASGARFDAGLAKLNLPHFPVHVPGPFAEGINIDITKVDIPINNPHWYDQYAGLAAQYDTSFSEPIKHALLERLALGAGLGAATAAAIGATTLHLVRQRRRNKELLEENAELKTRLGEEVDVPAPRPLLSRIERLKNRITRRAAAIVAIGAFSVAGCGVAVNAISAEDTGPPTRTPLPASIANLSPYLEDGTVSGVAGELLNTAAYGVAEYVENVDEFWDKTNYNFYQAFQKLEEDGHMSYQNDSNIVPLMHVTDIHCNYAYLNRFYSSLLQAFQPEIIMNTGDSFTNSGTMPYEKTCYSTFADRVREIDKFYGTDTPIVNVMGNHDPKKSIDRDKNPQIVTLNEANDYHAKIKGLDFVGDTDPEATVWSVPRADQAAELNRRIVAQGHNIAKTACKIKEDTGTAPIALAHRRQALYETINEGCASIANNGHTHTETGFKRYTSDDGYTDVIQHTGGSATGAQVGIPMYDTAKQAAYATIELYDKTERTVVGYLTTTVHTDAKVDIEYHEVTRQTEDESETEAMHEYRDTYKK